MLRESRRLSSPIRLSLLVLATMISSSKRGFSVAFSLARPFSLRGTSSLPRASRKFQQHTLAAPSFPHESARDFSSLSSAAATLEAPASFKDAETVTHPAFEVVTEDFAKEYNCKSVIYRHKKSGAMVLSISAPEKEKVFGVCFRTPPGDSTGVPHILEHSVLCGSRLFPVKEPFAELLKGSLYTFLNAFTYPDRTVYPVASVSDKDFYNLARVYMDAVLHPRAVEDPYVLKQEGWHFKLLDKGEPLKYNGVVYNEMKGVYSSPDALAYRTTQQALFPDNEYAVDSGGDPKEIPTLTFDRFTQFYKNYYHPSNGRIFFFGDDDVSKRLDFLEEFLCDFEKPKSPVDSSIQWQALKKEPWRVSEKFPVAPGDADSKTMVSVNWLLHDEPLSPYDQLALAVLGQMLMGSPGAFLYRALQESGLGDQVTGGMQTELKQQIFSAGFKGMKNEDDAAEKVESLVLDTLKGLTVEGGIPQDAIDAAVNTLEFSLREFNTGTFPRGLALILGMLAEWIYERDPTAPLKFEAPLRQLKEDLQAGKPVFGDLIKKHMLDNGHRLTVVMTPDETLEKKQEEEEQKVLEEAKSKMMDEELAEIVKEAQKLKELQLKEDDPEALKSIPFLARDDLEKKGEEIPTEVSVEGGMEVLRHPLTTSGILYADLAVDLSSLDLEDLQVLPLLRSLMTEAGTTKHDLVTMSRRIGAKTGGVWTSSDVRTRSRGSIISSPEDAMGLLFIKGKAVRDRVTDLFDLMKEVLVDVDLNNKARSLELLKETRVSLETSIPSNGHSYATRRVGAQHSVAGVAQEASGGIRYLGFIRNLIAEAEKDWDKVSARLRKVHEKLLRAVSGSRNHFMLNLTGDEDLLKETAPAVRDFIASLPGGSESSSLDLSAATPKTWAQPGSFPPASVTSEGFVVPTQVNYVVKGGRLFEPGEEVSASSDVVGRALSRGFLWDNVRVVGGAYGAGFSFNPASGVYAFSSYRDPELTKTLAAYDEAAKHLLTLDLSEDALTRSIIGAVRGLDQPLPANQKGMRAFWEYVLKETPEQRQRERDEVLGTSRKDFKEFGERLLAAVEDSKRTSVAVVGSRSAIEGAQDALGLQVSDVFGGQESA
uniref:Peptidase M16C associated domain-containing protein n=1 Tax=Chromera velia CCMP2878 TaxID=1169474 RepID=A0A0G4G763_9ALVE|mmetsp:Transcript_48036/g.94882  ORF Transcript_48036/g.94882 Transcript_48036/m.94882 type:complete len:1104 (+) Transcript_48036:129-3440(+)|eukprot:Cvel_4274.t1-p1 / transcript=Cvel_4274.t1 / gene=Cvel_4274 / organism=Chromera_velia_CCMP2878 / gene_product=Presequence protease 1, chloroplastic/mitochondrial, putative / transcript_product=Presequence protease 1, chloroplastic/mitochondrial, putative / location=Cvel_scaffold185:40599-51320(+) / protein_length=1103 / sequence_SO=supercontig / SO=protein_coding / is_pseudo=false